ncbi:hypothetical protein HDV06_005346 [Boothiomyces sp. JEL0866]|nr:hypothetical protein HDV06_005346 [Boothiomyces sp. JEL0866]
MVRFKNRYFLIKVNPEERKDKHYLLSTIKDSIEELYQLHLPIAVKYYSPHTNILILRVPRDQFKECWHGVFFCSMRVVHISGTIKQLLSFCIKMNYKEIEELKKIKD